ncbi:hypothetical protein ROZALSC1DRAFT_26981 [Rozella allomycis CSF55]|uniref:Inositol hexakisphosphate and diphosphoinositol-pentakisphosphate kinase n=1 Tax=Rozella allomycis (strain CSF55) TaxID=988480 RepID=A0A4P9YPQ1_ROZAC|nr:hypothetical protein ROZALSC1DRAFT_26981 [Rozella allomycis CSF55]
MNGMPDMYAQALEESILQAASVVEAQIDEKIRELENADENSLESIRRQRIQQMKNAALQKAHWRSLGHGSYSELLSEKAFFEEGKKSKDLVCHFYRTSTFRCKILDRHLEALSKAHLEAKFVKIDAEKSPFLCERLGVRVLPTLVIVKDRKPVDQIVGFAEIGNKDDFETIALARRIAKSGVIRFEENEDYSEYGVMMNKNNFYGCVFRSSSLRKLIIGVCAMDTKARSKPMRNILDRITATSDFEVVIFGDKTILDDPIEEWPQCQFLISFFSKGFPLQKAIEYVALRRPFCINDLPLQQLLWDRRWVLSVLDAIDVPTPKRIIVNRDDGPKYYKGVIEELNKNLGIDLGNMTNFSRENVIQIDKDTIMVGKQRLEKPFVEKPVDGEDHNIYIYYPESMGGGVRKLFRKVGNKSSEFFPDEWEIRKEGSFIYETFIDVEKAEDIKVYTIGPYYAHAETRKSPVVDGIVRRNTDGKEVRHLTDLSEEEQELARRVSMAFSQTICGFDLVRCGSKSMVIDVNGWSFVKGNDNYYDMCAKIMSQTFLKIARKRRTTILKEPLNENQWKLKSFISIFRHADRTPKQKMKFNVSSAPFLDLIVKGKEETMIRNPDGLERIEKAAEASLSLGIEEKSKLLQLMEILSKKKKSPGTKVQIKPSYSKSREIEKAQLIVKWGGEFTHAGRHHSKDFGENLRKDLLLMNRKMIDDVKVYTSSERRVMATADIFSKALMFVAELPDDFLSIKKEMLDDNFDAKEKLDKIPENVQFLNVHPEFKNPRVTLDEVFITLKDLRQVMRSNFDTLDVDSLSHRWCCAESSILFKERWEKLFKDFCDVEINNFDPSKVSELYDSLKYDALHHREFFERIFVKNQNCPNEKAALADLIRKAKILFDFIAPQEFGLFPEEKVEIGKIIANRLLAQILEDLNEAKIHATDPCTRLYFTKESHVHALLNIVRFGGLECSIGNWDELDYLTQITFEVYERFKSNTSGFEYSIRIGFSPGAHDSNILDVQIDQKHALSVAPRRWITEHIPLDHAISIIEKMLNK